MRQGPRAMTVKLRLARARATRSLFLLLLVLAAAGGGLVWAGPAAADDEGPFARLAGRWLGEGRLGVRNGQAEKVKCRVTYFVSEQGAQVRQTIRCAADSGSVEVQSTVHHAGDKLTGTWKELSRNWSGDVAGSVTPNGFKVAVKGSELNANMDIILRNDRQIIEIQFMDSSLIGLTLVLTRG